jgi:hypothetical protein
MVAKVLKDVIEQAETWPEEDQVELAEYAREIEARRTGVYHATLEELQAIDEADRSGVATDRIRILHIRHTSRRPWMEEC